MHIIHKTGLRILAIVAFNLAALAGCLLITASYGGTAGRIFAACAFALSCGLVLIDFRRLWRRWLTWRFLRSLKKECDFRGEADLRRILSDNSLKSNDTHYEDFKCPNDSKPSSP